MSFLWFSLCFVLEAFQNAKDTMHKIPSSKEEVEQFLFTMLKWNYK